MNELLQKLATEAGGTEKINLGVYQFFESELEKFSVLLAKEVINEMIQNLWNYGIDESNNPSFYKAIQRTEETFGIEK